MSVYATDITEEISIKDAISQSQIKGYRLFKEMGGVSCHQGQNIGGNMMQKIDIINPSPVVSPDIIDRGNSRC